MIFFRVLGLMKGIIIHHLLIQNLILI